MVALSQIDKNAFKRLHLEALPRATREAFLRCISIPLFSSGKWYLAGGTALSLQTGHRQSVDLDFFITAKSFDEKNTEEQLSMEGNWKTSSTDSGTVYGELFGAKISLIAYPFFRPVAPFVKVGKMNILAPADIAVMKIIAISQRGRKRDFVDLYWLCNHNQTLRKIIERTLKQYNVRQNPTHLLKSLVFFVDAEDDPMPTLFFKANWRTIKNYFRQEVLKVTKALIKF